MALLVIDRSSAQDALEERYEASGGRLGAFGKRDEMLLPELTDGARLIQAKL